MAGGRASRHHHGHHVGPGKKAVQVVHGILFIQVFRLLPAGPSDADGVRAQSLHLPGIVSSDISKSQDQDRGALHRNDVPHGSPLTVRLVFMVLPQAADQIKGQGQHMLGYRQAIGPGGVREDCSGRKHSLRRIGIGSGAV